MHFGVANRNMFRFTTQEPGSPCRYQGVELADRALGRDRMWCLCLLGLLVLLVLLLS